METSTETIVGKFLIAIGDAKIRSHLAAYIAAHFSGFRIYEAHDGLDAISKLENDPPDVLILASGLTKRSHEQVISLAASHPKIRDIQIIFMGPDELVEQFEDLVASNRLQIVPENQSIEALATALYKAVNSINRKGNKFKMRFLRKGEILLRQGEKSSHIFILHRGKLCAYLGDAPHENTLGYITPGEFVGEMSYISNEPRSATVVAEEDSQLVEFSSNTFANVIYKKPSWMKALLGTLTKRIKTSNVKRTPGSM